MNSVVWKNDYILTANDNITKLWNSQDLLSLPNPEPIKTYPPIQETTWWGALSPDAKKVVTVGRDFLVRVYPENSDSYITRPQRHRNSCHLQSR